MVMAISKVMTGVASRQCSCVVAALAPSRGGGRGCGGHMMGTRHYNGMRCR